MTKETLEKKVETVNVPIRVFFDGPSREETSWTPRPTNEKKHIKFYENMLPEDKTNKDAMMEALKRIIEHDKFEASVLTGDDPSSPKALVRAEGEHRIDVIYKHFVKPGLIPEDYPIPIIPAYCDNPSELLILSTNRTVGKPKAANLRILREYHGIMGLILQEKGFTIQSDKHGPNDFRLLEEMVVTLNNWNDPRNQDENRNTPSWFSELRWEKKDEFDDLYRDLGDSAFSGGDAWDNLQCAIKTLSGGQRDLLEPAFAEGFDKDYLMKLSAEDITPSQKNQRLRIHMDSVVNQHLAQHALKPLEEAILETSGVITYESALGFMRLLVLAQESAKKSQVPVDDVLEILGGRSYGQGKNSFGAIKDAYIKITLDELIEPYRMRTIVRILDLSQANTTRVYRKIRDPLTSAVKSILKNSELPKREIVEFFEKSTPAEIILYQSLSDICSPNEIKKEIRHLDEMIWRYVGVDYEKSNYKQVTEAVKNAKVISQRLSAEIRENGIEQTINYVGLINNISELTNFLGLKIEEGELYIPFTKNNEVIKESKENEKPKKNRRKNKREKKPRKKKSKEKMSKSEIRKTKISSHSNTQNSSYNTKTTHKYICPELSTANPGDMIYSYERDGYSAIIIFSGKILETYSIQEGFHLERERRVLYLDCNRQPVSIGYDAYTQRSSSNPSEDIDNHIEEMPDVFAVTRCCYTSFNRVQDIKSSLGGLCDSIEPFNQRQIAKAKLDTKNLMFSPVKERLAYVLSQNTISLGRNTIVSMPSRVLDFLVEDNPEEASLLVQEIAPFLDELNPNLFSITDVPKYWTILHNYLTTS